MPVFKKSMSDNPFAPNVEKQKKGKGSKKPFSNLWTKIKKAKSIKF